MNILKVKGIIIRKTNFSDNDIIFDVLTDEGKIIGFFARGARKIKSRYSGVLQIGLIVNITYTVGKNLNYPSEIGVDPKNFFSFYSKSLEHMNFYTDIISILKLVGKDLEEPELFEATVVAFKNAQNGEDLVEIYNEFLTHVLQLISVDVELRCNISGQTINEKEFFYSPQTNRVISTENKPKSIDLPLISFDKIFFKQYAQRLLLEHVNHKIRFKF